MDSILAPPLNEIVVDLRDNATDSDVKAIDQQYRLVLKPNSVQSEADHIYIATVPGTEDLHGPAVQQIADRNWEIEQRLLARLKSDPRVEAAEPEEILSIPEEDGYTAPDRVLSDPYAGGYRINIPMRIAVRPGRIVAVSDCPALGGSGYITLRAPNAAETEALNRAAVSGYAQDDVAPSDNVSWIAPNDPRYNEQWNFRMIGMEDAWKRSRGKGVTVAVIDTGVAIGPSKRGTACRDFNNTAFVPGYDFVHKDADPFDDNGHGTHVAGTIAESTNNNEGVAGIAFDAKIMPIKVLAGNGSGTSADVAEGIRFAADHGANVINMSLGSSQPSDVIHKAVKYARSKGVTIVCAAGNSGREGVGYPAAYPECIAVSSVGPSGKLATYSSWGSQVALAAPGGDMTQSGDRADGILQNTNWPEGQGGHGDDYYAFQGTSMASPHVAGVAALIEAQGTTDPAKVRDLLLKSATPTAGDAKKYGAGILSAAAATAKAECANHVKLRDVLIVGFAGLLLLGGAPLRKRSLGLRAGMIGALALGMFGPDIWTRWVGADSGWNALAFSAVLPLLTYALLRKRGPAVKIAGALALGTAMNLYANWHNDTLPFTTATFGDAALSWTAVNLVAAIGIGTAAARRAFRGAHGLTE